jgi:hypothetical protein
MLRYGWIAHFGVCALAAGKATSAKAKVNKRSNAIAVFVS